MINGLTIAGSDSCGGAGIQADIKTMSANGVFAMSVITAVTAQSTQGVFSIEDISSNMIKKQINVIFDDIDVNVIKIGMVSKKESINAIVESLREIRNLPPIVIDPVMVSKNGFNLLSKDAKDALISNLIPFATLITPNILEAEEITNERILTLDDMKKAAEAILSLGPKAVLIKGGHLKGDAIDVLYDGIEFTIFEKERIENDNTHGTGCTLSSAIAANIAKGMSLKESVALAKEYVTNAIKHGFTLGKGIGPTHHFYKFYNNQGEFIVKKEKNKFDDLIENHKNKDEFDLKSKKIYLITDYRLDFDILVEKVRIALECGIKIVQYRAKEKSTKDMCAEARVLKQLCHEYNAIFIVNDRVDIALVVDAHGVHLGREDMKISEAKKILGEGKIIGATAHNEKEALEAISEGATYLGVGALYKSKSKSNTVNLSIETLQKIRKITDNPIFGIGGITENNINSSLRENIDGVAVISAIFQTNNIKNTIKEINENLK